MSPPTRNVVCPHCETVNRIPADKPGAKAKCGRCHKAIFTGKPFAVSAQAFEKHLKYNDIPVVVDFWAEWCGPCRVMAPAFERVAGEVEPEARFLKVDIEAERDLATRYEIRGIPLITIFRNGSMAAHRPGASDANSLRAFVAQHLARAPEGAAP